MKLNDAERFYQALKTMEIFFRDKLTDEHELLYWDTMRDQCTIGEWEYACHKARGQHDFNAVPLPAKLRPFILEYRAERRRQWELHQLDQRLLAPQEEPSRDPAFRGTERERKAVAAAKAEQARAKLEAKWAAAEAQGQPLPKPYRKLGAEDLRYLPTEDPAKARARALSLIAELRREEGGGHGPLH